MHDSGGVALTSDITIPKKGITFDKDSGILTIKECPIVEGGLKELADNIAKDKGRVELFYMILYSNAIDSGTVFYRGNNGKDIPFNRDVSKDIRDVICIKGNRGYKVEGGSEVMKFTSAVKTIVVFPVLSIKGDVLGEGDDGNPDKNQTKSKIFRYWRGNPWRDSEALNDDAFSKELTRLLSPEDVLVDGCPEDAEDADEDGERTHNRIIQGGVVLRWGSGSENVTACLSNPVIKNYSGINVGEKEGFYRIEKESGESEVDIVVSKGLDGGRIEKDKYRPGVYTLVIEGLKYNKKDIYSITPYIQLEEEHSGLPVCFEVNSDRKGYVFTVVFQNYCPELSKTERGAYADKFFKTIGEVEVTFKKEGDTCGVKLNANVEDVTLSADMTEHVGSLGYEVKASLRKSILDQTTDHDGLKLAYVVKNGDNVGYKELSDGTQLSGLGLIKVSPLIYRKSGGGGYITMSSGKELCVDVSKLNCSSSPTSVIASESNCAS